MCAGESTHVAHVAHTKHTQLNFARVVDVDYVEFLLLLRKTRFLSLRRRRRKLSEHKLFSSGCLGCSNSLGISGGGESVLKKKMRAKAAEDSGFIGQPSFCGHVLAHVYTICFKS